jgi:hypothetical protein
MRRALYSFGIGERTDAMSTRLPARLPRRDLSFSVV